MANPKSKKKSKAKSKKRGSAKKVKSKGVKQYPVRNMALSKLCPDPNNPRFISEAAASGLRNGLEEFGMLGVPVFNTVTGELVGGHKRVEQLLKLGETHAKTMLVEFSPEEQRAANVLLNNPEIGGEFDVEKLGELLDDIRVDMPEVFDGAGFSDLEALLFEIEAEAPEKAPDDEFDADYIPPPPAKPRTKLGAKVTIGRHTLHCADCMEVLAGMADNSVDAIVTDPPYGLSPDGQARTWDDVEELRKNAREAKGEEAKALRGFMGNAWDAATPGKKWASECLRVLKPGGYMLAASSGRTYHVLAYAVDKAGFDMLEMIDWLYTSNMPKSMDISKAFDKRRDDREQVLKVTAWIAKARDKAGIANKDIDDAFGFSGMAGHWTSGKSQPSIPTLEQLPGLLKVLQVEKAPKAIAALLVDLNERKGELGEDWHARETDGVYDAGRSEGSSGYGINAKGQGKDRRPDPHSEVAKRWEGWGTALKNCKEPFVFARKPIEGTYCENIEKWGVGAINIDGCRLPSGDPRWWGENGDVGEVSSFLRSSDAWEAGRGGKGAGMYAPGSVQKVNPPHPKGRWPPNAIHFSKPSRSEKEAGCEELPRVECASLAGGENPNDPVSARFRSKPKGNQHPTVKPVGLMEYLLTLVCPPGSHVFEPFGGSGTTLVAARTLDMHITSAELDPKHCDIIRARVEHSEKLSPFNP